MTWAKIDQYADVIHSENSSELYFEGKVCCQGNSVGIWTSHILRVRVK